MKKNLILISLMFSVMLLVAMVGLVSATCTQGEACDDGNVCTENETYRSDCSCVGDLIPGCTIQPYCGDRIITPLEECDGLAFGGATCESVMGTGYIGILGCYPAGNQNECQFDTSGCYLQECGVTVYLPTAGWYTNSIHAEWEYSQTCTIFDQEAYYRIGPNFSESISITEIDNSTPRILDWNAPLDGEYKICVNGQTEEGETTSGVIDCSETFDVDLTPPEVFINTVSEPKIGECADGETEDCYVNIDTEITLRCGDVMPGSGGGLKEYRYRIHYEDNSTSDWTEWDSAQGGFNFPQDSEHELEYRCFDGVGLESVHKFKTFYVDTQAPEITRTVTGPQECPESDPTGCTEYFNTDTEICVFAVDPQPHPVGLDSLNCEATWRTITSDGPATILDIDLEDNGCFNYTEDSWHSLRCWASDLLGNENEVVWSDVVDDKTPITTLSYTGPYYNEDEVQWIDTVSRVVLTAEDQEPHPVEGVSTFYRVEKLDDNSWCYGTSQSQWQETPKTDESWQEYTAPFEIDESCHVIEYYSTDLLGNSEDVNVEFVFSDHTAPLLDIDVGESGKDCNSQDVDCEEGWDWIVTMGTPITISCEDQLPHPSGVQKICYTIFWDGDTEQPTEVCENTNKATIWFGEPCEHGLEYTCYDNVEKHSSDSRTFKVIGENFTISLDKKWNLISVPVNLLSSSVEEVFNNPSIEEVWSYEDGEWFYYAPGDEDSTLTDILPGRGYWVKTSNPTVLVIGGSLFEEGSVIPNSVPITSGWNLIGHYGLASKPRICALASIFNK